MTVTPAPRPRAPGAWLLAALALTVAPSCARHAAPAPARPVGGPTLSSSTSVSPSPAWRFQVEAGPGARELSIEAEFVRGSSEELSVSEGAEPFVKDVEVERGGVWARVEPRGGSWFVPSCPGWGCHVRYRFLLAEAAAAIGDLDLAEAYGGEAFVAPPYSWLLRPFTAAGPGRVRLSVATPPGVEFVTGLRTEGGDFVASIDNVADAPYSGFGRFRTRRLELEGGEAIDLAFAPGPLGLDDDRIAAYVAANASAIASFYGHFPVERALVVIAPVGGRGVVFGKTSGGGGAAIVMMLGETLREGDLRRDWVMAHEMVHLGFPWLPRRHRWLEEGLATYVEPLVRLRAGFVDEQEVWRDFVTRMPQGLPRAGDRGLDRTPTWGRTYWGGALFCLLADVEIRKRSAGAHSLEDALRGVVRAGGNASTHWRIEDALTVGDEAVGVPVLRELYAAMAERPAPVDLPRLFRELGVRHEGGRVHFDDAAPLAAVRKAITGPGRPDGLAAAPGTPRPPAPRPLAPASPRAAGRPSGLSAP